MSPKIVTETDGFCPRHFLVIDGLNKRYDITDQINGILAKHDALYVEQMHELRRSFEDKISRYEEICSICTRDCMPQC